MSHKGKIQLIYIFVAPPDQVEEGDRIFRSHAPWMEATHHRDGDKALLSYNVSKAPELSNPVDPNSAPTGNTCFILSEIYETAAGVADHFEMSDSSWQDFPSLLKWAEKCTVTGLPAAPIINSL
ncbi:MAG: hypothetical protein WCA07_05135 [Gloeobacterales cyanobacterium]